ncbi:MAG: hypothetical protein D6733_03675 [Methanobacteriota archaeon]|nr:MAG: hypothetical protein D6733_03675 [Euryarchaeota archaeon]
MKRSWIPAALAISLLLLPLAGADQVVFESKEQINLIYTSETGHAVKFVLPTTDGVEGVVVTVDARITPSGYNEYADGIGGLLVQLNSELPVEGDFGVPAELLKIIEEEAPAFRDVALHVLWFAPSYLEGSLGTRGIRRLRFERAALFEGENVLLLQNIEQGKTSGEGDGIFIKDIRVEVIGNPAGPPLEKNAPPVVEETQPSQGEMVTRPPLAERGEPGPSEREAAAPAPAGQPEETNWEAIGVFLVVAGSVGGWFLSRRKRGRVKRLIDEIDTVYSNFKMKSRRCEAELYRLKDLILEEFKNGRIDDNSYAILDRRIEDYLREIREQIVNERFGGIPQQLRASLRAMMEDGEISEKDYTTLQRLLKDATGVKESDKEELRELFERWKKEDQK